MKIESRDLSVDDLLNSSYFFIPRFQRPYSWEEENITDFWNDINENADENYFIGSMVVYQYNKGTLGLVDGQQRLTTITILLCAIRDAFQKLDEPDKAAGLHKFVEKPDRDNLRKFVLQTESSFPYLQEKILNMGDPDIKIDVGEEELALERAHNIFSQNIAQKHSAIDADTTVGNSDKVEAKVEWLVKLRDVVLALNAILVTLDNEDDAYLIFETLNTRGKDLSLSDLVRNLFARNLKPKGDVDHAKITWGKVVDTLSASDVDLSVDTFIVHSWSSRFEAVTQKKTFPKLRSAITAKTAKEHLSAFESDALLYRSVFEPSFLWDANEKKVARSLAALQAFKVVQPTPGILSLVRAYRDKKIKLGKLVNAVTAIEYFHFIFTAVTSSRSSGGISGMYSSFGRKLHDASDANVASAEIKALEVKLRQALPSPSEFQAAFEQVLYTNKLTKQRGLIRYILQNIALHLKLAHIGNEDELTIEHIVPQNMIGERWPEEIVGQIGNLMLVDEETNKKLGTKPFSEKKKILFANGYTLPEAFADVEEITPELIEENTKRLGELSYREVWRF